MTRSTEGRCSPECVGRRLDQHERKCNAHQPRKLRALARIASIIDRTEMPSFAA